MRIISLNANGIRSAANKGVFDWLADQSADLVCVQELKAQGPDLTEAHTRINGSARGDLFAHIHWAEKKGYSGVAVFSHQAPAEVKAGIGVSEFDLEGRILRADFEADQWGAGVKPLSVVSLYAPSGSASDERQASKFRFLDVFYPVLQAWMQEHQQTGREFVICGDWNIAHTEKDLKNWRGNLKNSGFLPEERAWFGRMLSELGWVDVYRQLHPNATEEGYTWWSNRGQAWAKNVGWRIDYQIATPGLAACAQSAQIHKASRFSDHAPLIIDYAL
ncbi:exodeoxyribonuclease III [Betaproteobacteria bacterium LSUCC0115]|nr:exodeoxyribonuclease III [Burkholderiales bacterium LSUCC0115]